MPPNLRKSQPNLSKPSEGGSFNAERKPSEETSPLKGLNLTGERELGSVGGIKATGRVTVGVGDLIGQQGVNVEIDATNRTAGFGAGIGSTKGKLGVNIGGKIGYDEEGRVSIKGAEASINIGGFGGGASIDEDEGIRGSISVAGAKVEVGITPDGKKTLSLCYGVPGGELCVTLEPDPGISIPIPPGSGSDSAPPGGIDMGGFPTSYSCSGGASYTLKESIAQFNDMRWFIGWKTVDFSEWAKNSRSETFGRYWNPWGFGKWWEGENDNYTASDAGIDKIDAELADYWLGKDKDGRPLWTPGALETFTTGNSLGVKWYFNKSVVFPVKSVVTYNYTGKVRRYNSTQSSATITGTPRFSDFIFHVLNIEPPPPCPTGESPKPETRNVAPPKTNLRLPNYPQHYKPMNCCDKVEEIYQYLGIAKLKKNKFPVSNTFLVPGGTGNNNCVDYYSIMQALFRMLANGLILNPKCKPLGSEYQNVNATAWAADMYEMAAESMSDGNSSQRFEVAAIMQLVQIMGTLAENGRKIEFVADAIGIEPQLVLEEVPVCFTVYEGHKGFGKKEPKKINVSNLKTDKNVEHALGNMLKPSQIPITTWKFKPGQISIKEALRNG